MTYHVVYHRKDLDGICSGGIVYRALREKNVDDSDIVMVPHDYSDPTDWIRKVKLGDSVYLVDISLSRPDWATLLGIVGVKVVWIDHHSTAIQDYLGSDSVKGWKNEFQHLPGAIEVFLGDSRNNKAGCYLTWEYFEKTRPVPPIVQELSRFDVWDNEDKTRWENIVMPIHHIIGLIWKDPKSPPNYAFDEALAPDVMVNLIGTGKLLYDAHKKQLASASRAAFETNVFDLPAVVLNAGGAGSLAFEKVYDPAKHKLMVSFAYDGPNKTWNVGLYSTHDDVHCGKLAKLFKGGGHAGAAGFSVKKLSEAFPKYFSE